MKAAVVTPGLQYPAEKKEAAIEQLTAKIESIELILDAIERELAAITAKMEVSNEASYKAMCQRLIDYLTVKKVVFEMRLGKAIQALEYLKNVEVLS